jgi:hypothetical protein
MAVHNKEEKRAENKNERLCIIWGTSTWGPTDPVGQLQTLTGEKHTSVASYSLTGTRSRVDLKTKMSSW